ncbi:hypothetical protein NRB56_06560 [Nocardia sp. RB56]|uniref:Uncharacterized protein n=1 Tax=Nocardia aurantia TaxID=2585199 RepID=A0A7K0DHQ7_9NOCA|nr:hypothetical protein [Nocardia aurantia]
MNPVCTKVADIVSALVSLTSVEGADRASPEVRRGSVTVVKKRCDLRWLGLTNGHPRLHHS